MRAIAFVFVILCAGCAHVQYGSGAGVQANAGNALGAVLLGGMLATAGVEDSREPQPTSPTLADWIGSAPAPAMSADRPVAEQDCTKPVALTGNLRCK